MHAELIAIGAELLLGEITDSNSAHIARALREVGVAVQWISVVGDHSPRITDTVRAALQRAPIVITTGGLGPTVDDPTRAAIANACGVPLEYRPELWEQIVARFQRYGRIPGENNRQQAYVPQGARPLENPVGTAPCFMVEHPHGVLVALPGVPREMEHMLARVVIPILRERFQLTQIIRAKIFRTVGLGESAIDEKIGDLEKLENPVVGLAAHPGQTDIRITAQAANEVELAALMAPIEARLRAELGEAIYGEGNDKLEEVVGRLLAAQHQTVAVAEHGANNLLAHRLGVVAQTLPIWRGAIPADADTAIEMRAQHARAQTHADWGLALTLTAHTDHCTAQIALANAQTTETRTLGYGGPPAYAATWVTTAALNLLRLSLLSSAGR